MAKGNITKRVEKIKTVLKEASGELVLMKDQEKSKIQIKRIVAKHKDLKVDENNLKEGLEARSEVRNLRLDIKNTLDHNKKLLNGAKKTLEEQANEFIGLVKPEEDRLSEEIKVVQDKKQREKEEKERKEKERIDAIQKRLLDKKIELERLALIGKNDEDLVKFEEEIKELKDLDSFEEFAFEAEQLESEFEGRESEIKDRIEEDKKKKQEKEEQAERQKQLDADAKKLKEEKDKFEKEKAEFAAKQAVGVEVKEEEKNPLELIEKTVSEVVGSKKENVEIIENKVDTLFDKIKVDGKKPFDLIKEGMISMKLEAVSENKFVSSELKRFFDEVEVKVSDLSICLNQLK